MNTLKEANRKSWKEGKRRRALAHLRFMLHDILLFYKRFLPTEQLLNWLPAVQGAWPESNEQNHDQPLVFAVCDPAYFALHAEPLLASINKYSPTAALHLHLYDPSQVEFARLALLKTIYQDVVLTHTWEYTDLAGLNEEQRIIYFQSVRFIRLYSAMKASRRPIITLDVDSLIRNPLKGLIATAADADIGLMLRPEFTDPGKKVLASFVYAAPSAAALRYFKAVARRLTIHILAAVQTEKMDQRCLWKAYSAQYSRLKLWEIPLLFSDWSMEETSPIWHGKGPRKELEQYMQECHRIMNMP